MNTRRHVVALAAVAMVLLTLVASAERSFGETRSQEAASPQPAGTMKGLAELAPLTPQALEPPKADWLVVPCTRAGAVLRDGGAPQIVMTNGLVSRTFRILPNAATVGFDNLLTSSAIIRGVKPEAILELDGVKYAVGGLVGQPEYAYLRPEWIDGLKSDPAAFQFTGFEVGSTRPRFAWKRKPYSASLPWPPPGARLTLRFHPPGDKLAGLAVDVCYEMYDGIPLVCKWLAIRNGGPKPIRLKSFVNEILAAVEAETTGPVNPGWEYPNLHVESDYAFNGATPLEADVTTHWVLDPQYVTQRWATPALMESRPPIGPDALVAPGTTFETFRTFELIYDSTDRERKGLALRRMYRTIAPWVTENPLYVNVTPADPVTVRRMIDQCAEVGFEMVGLSFASGFDIENDSPAYVREVKELVDYAHRKGIELGGYSLLASRSVGPADDVIDPRTKKPGGAVYGSSPCLGSRWGEAYIAKVKTFIERAGLDLFEHDGSYPGDLCASTRHAGHRGLTDSQWTQWQTIAGLYRWCRGRGVHLNVPDWYFLNGSNKVFLGYREENWTLPRESQVILSRQNIFDGTWQKTPSMGWAFLPLVNYKGGGAAALIEPLAEHLEAYEAHLAQNFGCGIQACYRGWRLYDTEATKAMIKKWTQFYRKYRPILESDIIHVRRPDGRHLDAMFHVNPQLKPRGLAFVFNPRDCEVESTLVLPLYYTGLTDVASVRREHGKPASYRLDRNFQISFPLKMAAKSWTWLAVE